jgi:predicted nucleic acid-binding protein
LKVDYLDASAWVKRYYQEPGTEATQALFVEGAVLACASLGPVEVLATLSRKQKARQISQAQLQQKRIDLEADWQQFIQVQFSAEVLEKALTLAADLSLRGADAVHLASAIVLQQNLPTLEGFRLVCCDNELLEAAQQMGITIFNPASC